MPDFVPGLELCGAFHDELVAPALRAAFPRLRYSAALLGNGSDVLGFDTERSTDHGWGPRLQLFLSRAGRERHAQAISEMLARSLPLSFRGHPTNWTPPGEDDSWMLAPIEHGPVHHRVVITSVPAFMCETLGFNPGGGVSLTDWLVTPSHLLLSVTAGAVYHDGLGELQPVRDALAWYPHDVWLYLIACQWTRIAQEEPFAGRCGEAGDELGSRVVAARLVRDLIKLCFLLERRYAPYSKWLGTAFARLASAGSLMPSMAGALAATDWQTRDRRLADAYELVATLHNRLGITAPADPTTRPFYNRPYQVLRAERFAETTREAIRDETVRALEPGVGSIDQWVDSTDVLSRPSRVRRAAAMLRKR